MVFAHKCVAPLSTASRIPSSVSGKHQPESCAGSGADDVGLIMSIPAHLLRL